MIQIIQSRQLEEFLTLDEIVMFQKLQKIIHEINKVTNLTRLIEGDDYWISQVYDSLWPFFENSKKLFQQKKFIDIGSGCGFPGLAYALTHPNSEVYLVDSSKKKTEALKRIIETLALSNKIFIINERIETFAHNPSYRNNFDIAAARAVSSPSTVSEYLLPMLKPHGKGLIYCGKWTLKDESNIQNSLKVLNGAIESIKKTYLPKDKGERNVIFIESEKNCPNQYPRAVGKPKKYPL